MATSRVIHGNDISYSQWEVPDFDGGNEKINDDEEEIILPSAEEIEEIRQSAYREGFEEGKGEGYDKGYSEGIENAKKKVNDDYEDKKASLNKAINDLVNRASIFDNSIVDNITETIILVAKQIIRREIKTAPEQIVSVVRESLSYLPVSSEKIMIRVNNDEGEFIENSSLNNVNVEVIYDASVTAGGCIVETSSSKVDMTYERRVSMIVSNILGGARKEDKDG